MVEDEAVEPVKCGDGGGDESLSIFGCGERLGYGAAELRSAAFGYKGFSLLGGRTVVEDHLCSGLTEEAYGGRADAARAPGDQGNAACERQGDSGVGDSLHMFERYWNQIA
jgi:hypothetical protein